MSHRLIVLVSLAAVASTSLGARQQQTPASVLILGRVVDAVSGQPLAGATVTIVPAPPAPGSPQPVAPAARVRPEDITGPTRVMTDGDGRFVFYGLPAGAFTINASKPGYMTGTYGRRTPAAVPAADARPAPLVLAAGAQRSDIAVSLWKYGVISGRVVDEQGEPMIGVQVRVLRRTFVAGRLRLSQTGNMPPTDDRGIYRNATLEPGDYVAAIVTTHATMPAAVFESYAAAVRAGDSLGFTRMLDAGGAAIVRDGVRVGSLLVGSGTQAPGGSSRIIRRPAVLPPTGGRLLVYPTVYHPGVSTPAEASVFTVTAGEERGNVDFQLRPVPASIVSGTLTGPDGPVPHTGLELLPAGIEHLTRDDGFEAATTVTDDGGAFTFLGVTPGQHRLRALRVPERPQRAPSSGAATIIQTGTSTISSGFGALTPEPIPDEPTWWASMPVAVGDSDIESLTVALRPGARIRGRVQFDGTAKPPQGSALERVSLTIESGDGRTSGSVATFQTRTARVDADGRLNSYQLPPNAYILRPGAPPPGWTFASAMLDGRDVSVEPFTLAESDVDVVIRFTDRPSELSGTISTDVPSGDLDLLAVVFPLHPRGWTDYGLTPRRLRSSSRKGAGAFSFVGLPVGDYHVAAILQDAARDWRDPAFLKKLASLATRVSIVEGEHASVTVRPVEVR